MKFILMLWWKDYVFWRARKDEAKYLRRVEQIKRIGDYFAAISAESERQIRELRAQREALR